jgi:hypothetical protein
LYQKNKKINITSSSSFSLVLYSIKKKGSKPLDLIHTDICDLKFKQTRASKKYLRGGPKAELTGGWLKLQ